MFRIEEKENGCPACYSVRGSHNGDIPLVKGVNIFLERNEMREVEEDEEEEKQVKNRKRIRRKKRKKKRMKTRMAVGGKINEEKK